MKESLKHESSKGKTTKGKVESLRENQEILQRSERRLKDAQRMAKVGNWELNLVTNKLFWSAELYRIFEVEQTEFGASYEAFLKTIHPEDRSMVNEAYQHHILSQEPYSITHRILLNSGEVKYVEEQCYSDFGPNGIALFSYGTVQDITERVEKEKQLQSAIKLLEKSNEVARIGTWEFDVINQTLVWSKVTHEIYDVPVEDGVSFEIAVSIFKEGKDRDLLMDLFQKCIENGEEYDVEVAIVTPKNNERIVRAIGIPEFNDAGECISAYGTVQDITQRKRVEEINSILYNIAVKSNDLSISLYDFCSYVHKEISRIIDASDFYIAQEVETDNIVYHYLKNDHFKGEPGLEAISRNCLAQMILDDGKPLRLNTSVQEFLEELDMNVCRFDAKSWLGAPIIWNGKTIGVIACKSYTEANFFTQQDEEILSTVGSQLGIFIESKRTSETLKVNELQLRQSQKIGNFAHWTFEFEDRKLIYSDEVYRIFEVEKEELKDNFQTYLASIHFADKERVKGIIENAISNKIGFSVEHQIIMKDKTFKWVSIKGAVYNDEDNNPVRILGTIQDITASSEAHIAFTKKLEEQVQERTHQLEVSRRELNFQVETLDQTALVSMADTDGVITYVNERMCDVLGYTADELVGQPHRVLSSRTHSKKFFRELWKTIQSGNVWKGEILNKAKDGELFWHQTTIVPFLNVQGEVERYIAVRFDISELKSLQEQLSKSLEKEVELGNMKSMFVSTASHQFRTPLTVIKTNSSLIPMLIDKVDNEKAKEKFEVIFSRINYEIDRMTELMDEILNLGKINEGKLKAQKEIADILAICERMANNYSAIQRDSRSVDISYSGVAQDVFVDEKLISHSVGNLLSNAFKYSKDENPKLKLDFGKSSVKITVSDKGMGIPEKEQAKLFQPFHRASNVEDIAGTGIGLCIVKEYVELNDGSVSVESKENKGTSFTIELPLHNN